MAEGSRKAFNIVEVPKRLKVRFGMYMLIEDAEAWWSTLLQIKYGGEEPMWDEFVEKLK